MMGFGEMHDIRAVAILVGIGRYHPRILDHQLRSHVPTFNIVPLGPKQRPCQDAIKLTRTRTCSISAAVWCGNGVIHAHSAELDLRSRKLVSAPAAMTGGKKAVKINRGSSYK
jgi:hypothetical protein